MAFLFWGKNKKKEKNAETATPDIEPQPRSEDQVEKISVNQIIPNRFQPRQIFAQEKIDELADTIKDHGLLQPIILREYEPGKYEIIAGERRFRAIQTLKWEK